MTEPNVLDIPIKELLIEVQPIAARVGRTVGRHFEEFIEVDDLVQDLLLWSLDHEDKVREYLTPTEEDPTCKVGRRKMHTTFRRKARAWAHKAKADRLGYEIKDLHFYSLASLEELLPLALDYDEWMAEQGDNTGSKTKTDPAVGNNKFALLVDAKRAYETGSVEDRELLTIRYVDDVSLDVMAADEGVSRTTISRRVDRALARMLDRLGGSRPDFATHEGRTVMTNAQAQAMLGSYFD